MAMNDKLTLALLAYLAGASGDFDASPGARYLRLWTTAPGADNTGGTEVSGGSYAAESFASEMATPSTGDDQVANDTLIQFPTATADWGTIVAVTISTATTGTASILDIITLDNPVTNDNGATFQFAVGAFVIKAR